MVTANKNLNQIIKLVNGLNEKSKEYLESFLSNAPLWIFDSFQIINMEKNKTFIRENDEVDLIYILMDGVVRAVDYRIMGIEYSYMGFYPVKVFGSMEVLLDRDKYETTLITDTPCKMLVLSTNQFKKWMSSDINALQIEIKTMGTYLLEQAKKERIFLFMEGIDRVFVIFTKFYENNAKDNKCVISETRKDLSNYSGLSIKTINRSIKVLEEQHYIEKNGSKIIVTKEQYERMKDYIIQKLEQM